MNTFKLTSLAIVAGMISFISGCLQVESRPGSTYRVGSATPPPSAAAAPDNRPTDAILAESSRLRQQKDTLELDYAEWQQKVKVRESQKDQLKRDRDALKKDREYWKKLAGRD